MQALPFDWSYQDLSQCFSRPVLPISTLDMIFLKLSIQQQLPSQCSFRISHKTARETVTSRCLKACLSSLPLLVCSYAFSCLLISITCPSGPFYTTTKSYRQDKLHLFSYNWGQCFLSSSLKYTESWNNTLWPPRLEFVHSNQEFTAHDALHTPPSPAPGATVSISSMSKLPMHSARVKAKIIQGLCSSL